MRVILILLCLLSPFYLATGMVYEEGGFGYELVVKPRPSFTTVFGGGEEGTWRRDHPNEPLPWWQSGHYRKIASSSWEGGTWPWWSWGYGLGRLFLLFAWPLLAIMFLLQKYKQRSSTSSALHA